MNFHSGILMIVTCALTLGCAPETQQVQTSAPPTTAAAAPSSGNFQADVASRLNAYRASAGRSGLTYDARLARAAQKHASFMASSGRLTHTGRGGSSTRQRVTAEGFNGCLWAENVAMGQKNPQEVMESWRTSSGHNKNMLLRDATHVGVGFAGGEWWVQVFAKGC